MTALDRQQLQKLLPQAYPFVLLDRVTDIRKGESLTAIKNITANEWPFDNDDPGREIEHYPEVLLIEAAAQAALVLYKLSYAEAVPRDGLFVLGKVKCQFEAPVRPGEQVAIAAEARRMVKNAGLVDVMLRTEAADVGSIQVFSSIVRDDARN